MLKKTLLLVLLFLGMSEETSCTPSVSKSLNIAKRTAQVGAYSIITAASVGAGVVGVGMLVISVFLGDPHFRGGVRYLKTETAAYGLCGAAILMGSYEVIKKYSAKAKTAYSGEKPVYRAYYQNSNTFF